MTQDLALKMRNLLQTIFDKNETDCYHCAIRKTYSQLDDDDYTLCLYGNIDHSLFLVELATLAHALETLCTPLHAGVSEYDRGTTESDMVTCITLH